MIKTNAQQLQGFKGNIWFSTIINYVQLLKCFLLAVGSLAREFLLFQN